MTMHVTTQQTKIVAAETLRCTASVPLPPFGETISFGFHTTGGGRAGGLIFAVSGVMRLCKKNSIGWRFLLPTTVSSQHGRGGLVSSSDATSLVSWLRETRLLKLETLPPLEGFAMGGGGTRQSTQRYLDKTFLLLFGGKTSRH